MRRTHSPPRPIIFKVGSSEEMTILEATKWVIAAAGDESEIRFVPARGGF